MRALLRRLSVLEPLDNDPSRASGRLFARLFCKARMKPVTGTIGGLSILQLRAITTRTNCRITEPVFSKATKPFVSDNAVNCLTNFSKSDPSIHRGIPGLKIPDAARHHSETNQGRERLFYQRAAPSLKPAPHSPLQMSVSY